MLRTYFKYKQPIIQLITVIGLVALFMIIAQLLAFLTIKYLLGLSAEEVKSIADGNYTHPLAKHCLMGMQAVAIVFMFVGTAYTYAKLADKSATSYLKLHQFAVPTYGYVVLLVLVSVPIAGVLGTINSLVPLPPALQQMEDKATKTVEFLAKGNSVYDWLVSIVVVAGFAAIAEELLFRGVIQRIIIQGVKNPEVGILITACLFSAFHLQFKGFLPRMFLGVVLGFIYWYSRSLWPAILFHFLFNALGVTLASTLSKNKLDAIEKLGKDNNQIIGTSVILVMALAGLYLLFKNLKKETNATYSDWYPAAPSAFERDLS